MKKIIVFLLCICVLCTGCFASKKVEEDKEETIVKAEKISYTKLNDIVNNYSDYVNVDVVDVRSEEDFMDGHIIGAINIPLSDLSDIIIANDREIIVYADTSAKSRQAANELITLGYSNVKYITGIDNWPYDLEK